MKRRNFLTGLAASGIAPHLGACAEIMPSTNLIGTGSQSKPANLKITKVEVLRITGKNKRKILYLKIHTNEGLTGLYGPIDNEAAMHVVASQPIEVCPLVEYLIQKMSTYYNFEKHQPRPVNGILELPDRPGFGIEFDESKIEDIRPISWKQT